MTERVAIMLVRMVGGIMLVVAALSGARWADPFWKECVKREATPAAVVQEAPAAVKPALARPVTRWVTPPLYDGGPRTAVMHGCIHTPTDAGFVNTCTPQLLPGQWCTVSFDLRDKDGGIYFWYGGPYLAEDNGMAVNAGDFLTVDGRDLYTLAKAPDAGATVRILYGTGCE